MKSSIIVAVIVIAALAATGAAMNAIMPGGESPTPGGLRAVAADLAWLRANSAWEQRDPARTRTWLNLVVALDPRPAYFWINGARMMAYDFPAWRIADEGGYERAGAARSARIQAEEARRAIDFLGRAMSGRADSAGLWIERANIELNGLHDAAAAADSYRRASAQPRAPYFAARLHAELLRRLGRKTEARAWLMELHPKLPRDDEAAEADIVLGRIRELERDLAVPAGQAYVPPPESRAAGR